MIIKYQILPAERLTVVHFSGTWSSAVLKNSHKMLVAESEFQYVNKMLIDCRDIDLSLAIEDIPDLAISRTTNLPNKQKIVHLVSSPKSTASSQLYQDQLLLLGFQCGYCSTMKHALNLLNIEMQPIEMENIIMHLNRHFE